MHMPLGIIECGVNVNSTDQPVCISFYWRLLCTFWNI